MNIVNTTAPISIDNLKKYFVDKDTFFIIEYHNSTLKGKKLLTYLSNLDIPADISFSECSDEEFFEILQEYFQSSSISNIPFLEKAVISVLKEKLKLTNTDFFGKFIEDNKTIIDSWLSKIFSLTLFNMYTIEAPEFKQFVTEHPLDETDSTEGINFVSLLKHEEFYELYQKIDYSQVKFYKKYFEDYIFKGKNLYSYWANENNPMFLLTFSIANGNITNEEYNTAVKESIAELESMSSK
jgi:hypothetical protein